MDMVLESDSQGILALKQPSSAGISAPDLPLHRGGCRPAAKKNIFSPFFAHGIFHLVQKWKTKIQKKLWQIHVSWWSLWWSPQNLNKKCTVGTSKHARNSTYFLCVLCSKPTRNAQVGTTAHRNTEMKVFISLGFDHPFKKDSAIMALATWAICLLALQASIYTTMPACWRPKVPCLDWVVTLQISTALWRCQHPINIHPAWPIPITRAPLLGNSTKRMIENL